LAEDDWHRDRLDERKQGLIRQAVRELVEEVGEKPRKVTDVAQTAAENKSNEDAAGSGQYERCILCLPARDPADEIASMMVAQVLEHGGYCAEYVSVDRLASEYVELVEKKGAQVVIISALPPGAVAHARYLLKRLRARFPELRIIVGLWTVEGTLERGRERLASAGATSVTTSIEGAVEQVRQVVQPLMLAGAGAPAGEAEVIAAK
jgi:methylmalonyl-CoA mutase cobalamin-binding subunit